MIFSDLPQSNFDPVESALAVFFRRLAQPSTLSKYMPNTNSWIYSERRNFRYLETGSGDFASVDFMTRVGLADTVIASVAGIRGLPGATAYLASQAAVILAVFHCLQFCWPISTS
ncbi:MAG: hypothetical protein NTY41_16390 [Proteobacteria bacterium]|nr:hypothetical protein [Pseudomonadota bacterium]